MGTGGFHQVKAYYYRNDGLQGVDYQSRPNVGAGFEALLGDRDDKVLGLMRLYWMSDSPPKAPDTSAEDQSHTYVHPPAEDQPPEQIGAITLGVQWGVWGDPTGFQVVVTSLAGSGFATKDNLEFLIVEPGAGVTWTWNERVQLYGNVAYTLRYRKGLSLGENAYAGVRYLFD